MLFGIILFFQELCNKTQLYLNLSLFSSQKRVSTHFCCWLAEKLTWVKVAENAYPFSTPTQPQVRAAGQHPRQPYSWLP